MSSHSKHVKYVKLERFESSAGACLNDLKSLMVSPKVVFDVLAIEVACRLVAMLFWWTRL